MKEPWKPESFPNAVGPTQIDAPIYFLRIPGTGGAMLSAFLQSLVSASEYWRGDEEGWTALPVSSALELQKFLIIDGCFGGCLPQSFASPLRYICSLRDPLTCAVARYEKILRDPGHYFHVLAHELGSFSAYLRDDRTRPTITNVQLRYISASFDTLELLKELTPDQRVHGAAQMVFDTAPQKRSDQELLTTARIRLEQMCFVGITERFEDGLGLLCEVFDWPRPREWNSHGLSLITPLSEMLPEDTQLLKDLNEADIELYELAKARFERDWARSRFVYPRLHSFISYAQNCEDVLLHRALRDVERGMYIDVGANDPEGDSVTKAFYDRGWRGINIEPVTSLYQALADKRPEDVNIQAAAGDLECSMVLYEIPGTGLSTLDKSIAARHMEQGFKVNQFPIPVRTLQSILNETRRSEIHFLKIDVEGWEKQVLCGIDLESYRPWIVVIEATEPNTEIASYEAWEPLLLNQDYQFAFFDGLNRYYVASERHGLKTALSRPVNSGDGYLRASEAAAVNSLRAARWEMGKLESLLRERDQSARRQIEELTKWATSADTYGKSLLIERDALHLQLKALKEAREVERVEESAHTQALTQWATSADAYAKSLLVERDALQLQLRSLREAFDKERADATAHIEALTEWATSADTHGKSLLVERDALQLRLKALGEARDHERMEATALAQAHRELLKERDALEAQKKALEARVSKLERHWVVKYLVSARYLQKRYE